MILKRLKENHHRIQKFHLWVYTPRNWKWHLKEIFVYSILIVSITLFTLTKIWSSSFSILSFCLFIWFLGFSKQEYWSGLPSPSPVDHILSDLSTMTLLSWVPHRALLSFIELDKAVVLVWLGWLVFCNYGFSLSALWCPLTKPTVLLGFLLPRTRGIFSPPPLLTLNVA